MEDIGDGYFACEHLVDTHECPQRWIVAYSTKAKRRNEKNIRGASFARKQRRSLEFPWSSLRQNVLVSSRCAALCVPQEVQYKKRGRPKNAPFSFSYSVQEELVVLEDAFEQWCQSQNFFILATNDPDEGNFIKKEVLSTYKPQQNVEKGFRFLKSTEFFTSPVHRTCGD